MPAVQQIDFINRTRPRTGNFDLSPKITPIPTPKPKIKRVYPPKVKVEPLVSKDPVIARMTKEARMHRIKKNVDHKNRHHGSTF